MSLGSFKRFGQIQINLWRIYKRLNPLKAAKPGAKQRYVLSINKESLIGVQIRKFELKTFGQISRPNNNSIKRVNRLLCRLHIKGVNMMQDDKICANILPNAGPLGPLLSLTCYPFGDISGYSPTAFSLPVNGTPTTYPIDWSTLQFIAIDMYTQNMENADNTGWYCDGSGFIPTSINWGTSDATGPYWIQPVGLPSGAALPNSSAQITVSSIFVGDVEYGPTTLVLTSDGNGNITFSGIGSATPGNSAIRAMIRVQDTQGNFSNVGIVYIVIAYV